MNKKLLVLTGLFAAAALSLSAQGLNPQEPIPADPEVRTGRLDNGMTYYIRHNEKPAKMAEFYILHNVGSTQQDSTQAGLAHFLEHMAFNGTKNLPGKQIISYLESIGVKFGANLNAFTSAEMTLYNMSDVPVTREGIIDTALLILHDWSYFITLDPEEIDNERGVIVEERRTRNNAQARLSTESAPIMYNNNPKFAYEYLIGSEEFLRSFPHDALRDFYHRWYRTDQQAVIVVGDIDVDQIENKIKTLMADIPAVENPEPKIFEPVAPNDEPLIDVATDPEMQNTMIQFMIKRNPLPAMLRDKVIARLFDLSMQAGSQMASQRLQEIAQQPNAPFIGAAVGDTDLTTETPVFIGQVFARNGEAAKAFDAFYREIEKIRRYGFTESEFERTKESLLRDAERVYANRNDRRHEDFIWTYVNNYRKNNPMPSAETAWKLDSTLINMITLADVNGLFQQMVITPNNQVVVVWGPQQEGIATPTEAEIAGIMQQVMAAELEAYEDNTVKEPLIADEGALKGSRVKKTSEDKFGDIVWTLKNGTKVVVRPTDFKADEVVFQASALGGNSLLADDEIPSAMLASSILENSGVGKFSSTELTKQLAGKAISIHSEIANYGHGIKGATSPKDIETFMQLLYLYFTAPRFNEADYQTTIDQYGSLLENVSKNPQFIFSDSVNRTLYNHTPRRQVLSPELIDQVDFEKVKDVYNRLFADANDFTFTFVGNIDPEVLKPLVEKYIGSLPASKTKLTWRNDGIVPARGKVTNRFAVPMQAPKTTVSYFFSGDIPFNLDNSLAIEVLYQILNIRYTESVREEKGGTYSVGTYAYLSFLPEQYYLLMIQFDTDPKMVDELMPIIDAEFAKIATEGPKTEDLAKVKEYLVKERPDKLKNNNTWMNYIVTLHNYGLDLNSEYDKLLEQLDGEQVKAMATKILNDGNLVNVIMDPQE